MLVPDAVSFNRVINGGLPRYVVVELFEQVSVVDVALVLLACFDVEVYAVPIPRLKHSGGNLFLPGWFQVSLNIIPDVDDE